MASTIVTLTENIIQTPAVVAAVTAAKTDIEALQAGTTAVTTMTAAGASKVLTSANNRQTILLDTAAGSTVTLPAATGSGAKYEFVVSTLATSNQHKVQVANSADTMQGIIVIEDTDTVLVTACFAANASHDTITLNRSTTGSVSLGEWLEVQDLATNKWQVTGVLTATGTPATPFSAAV